MKLGLIFLFISSYGQVASAQSTSDTLSSFKEINQTKSPLICKTKTDRNPCSRLLPKYIELRNSLWDLQANPKAHGLENPFGEAYEDRCAQLEEGLTAIGRACLENQYKNCYPESLLKDQISLSELNLIFAPLKGDSHYRMRDPAIFCLDRARLLANLLSKKGYKTQIIKIDRAPVLIAPLLDKKDRYLDRYLDYHGTHYVVSIKVAPSNEEYLLDPQFSEAPVPKKEYFVSSIGSNCNEGEPTLDTWECNYVRYFPTFEPNYGETFRPQTLKSRYATQGDYIEDVLNGNQKTDCGFLPKPDWFHLKNRPSKGAKQSQFISAKLRAKLIIANLENNYQGLLNIDQKAFQREALSAKNKVSAFQKHIDLVCSNFQMTKNECAQIRKDYQIYLKSKID